MYFNVDAAAAAAAVEAVTAEVLTARWRFLFFSNHFVQIFARARVRSLSARLDVNGTSVQSYCSRVAKKIPRGDVELCAWIYHLKRRRRWAIRISTKTYKLSRSTFTKVRFEVRWVAAAVIVAARSRRWWRQW